MRSCKKKQGKLIKLNAIKNEDRDGAGKDDTK